MRSVVERAIQQWVWDTSRADELLDERIEEVADGRKTPYDVAAEILEQVKSGALR
jgi:hypothetical protein